MVKLEQLVGANVAVSFRRPHLFGGRPVVAVAGRCQDAWHPGPIVLTDIHEARDQAGADVTDAAGLTGKTIVINSNAVAGVVAG